MTLFRLVLLLAVSFLAACSAKLQPIPYQAPTDVQHRMELQPGMTNKMSLFGQMWLPQSQAPQAILLLVHGTAEHSGLFAPLAETLARAGYGVYGLDLQGWGRSPGYKKRMGSIKSHDDYVRDVAATYITLRRQYPGLPIYGVGESLGGTVLLRGQLTGVLNFTGLIMSGPGYRPNPSLLGIRGPAFAARLGLWSAGLFGDFFPNWPTIPTNLGIRMAICSPDVQKRMLKDPYVSHQWLPASYLSGLADSQPIISDNLDHLDFPFLIIHGEKDSLIPRSSSEEIIRRSKTRDKQLSIIPKGCHANFIETPSWPQAAKLMIDWLKPRTQPAAPITTSAEILPVIDMNAEVEVEMAEMPKLESEALEETE